MIDKSLLHDVPFTKKNHQLLSFSFNGEKVLLLTFLKMCFSCQPIKKDYIACKIIKGIFVKHSQHCDNENMSRM